MNDNCLKGMKCPKCGSEGPFLIAARCWAEVNDDGIDGASDYEWGEKDACLCRRCTHQGTVGTFSFMD